MKALFQHMMVYYFYHIPGNEVPGWGYLSLSKVIQFGSIELGSCCHDCLSNVSHKNVETFAKYLNDSNSNDIFPLLIDSVFMHCVE